MKTNAILAASAAALAMPAVPAEFGRKDGGAEPDVKQLTRDLKEATDKVKEFAEDAKGRLEKGEQLTEAAKQSADEALVKFNELSAQMTEIEQKLAGGLGGSDNSERKSLGQRFVENEDVKAFMERAPSKGSVGVEVKAITSATGDGDGNAGDLLTPDDRPGIITPPQRRMTVRDLLTPGRTSDSAIRFFQETGFTNNAAPQAETELKAESSMKFGSKTLPVATIAHWVPASKQILADAPMLASYIDGRLRYGLAYVEELQLLKGDGTGDNLLGIIPQATPYNGGGLVAGTRIDQIRYAHLQAVLAEYPATGTVMHPSDWAEIETAKDENGRYIIGNPQDGTERKLWRLPVVETPAMTVGKFLAGAFKLGAQIFDREDANVEISTEDRDNFVKNMVTIRAEERLGLAVYRPECFIYGDLIAAPAA